MAGQSLKDKTVKGVGWSAVDNVTQYAVSFVVSIILARLLTPDDYGLIGIIAVFNAVCTAIINGGFTDALIRKKNVVEEDYSTVFIVNMVMSLLLYVAIFFFSPLIAHFFAREELTILTRVSSLGVIIGALGMVQQTRLTKLIDFKTQTKISLIAAVSSGVLGIILAVLDYGVWSLVAQSLSSQFIRTLLLWYYNKWMPTLFFSDKSFKELFGFGWKMMVIVVLNSIWKELYQVIIGKFYSPATLGQYTRSKQFAQMFSSNLTTVVQRVTYPVLSSIQDEKDRMIAAYRRIIKTTMFTTAVSMFALGAVSEPLLYCLIGSQWGEAATYLPLICISSSLYPLHAINLNMLQVQGRSDLFLGIEIIKKVLGLFPLYIGAVVGIIPMLWVSLIVGIVSFFLNSYFTGKFLGYSSWMQIKDVLPSYGTAVLIAIPVWLIKYLPISNWIILPIQIIVGASIFILLIKITKMEEYDGIRELVMPYLIKLKIIRQRNGE